MSGGSTPPLAGLKVVELARILAGPWIGQTLADLGADVIKVEGPGGDDTRTWGPPFIERPDRAGRIEKVAAYFHAANRGKTSIVCDFGNDEQLASVKALIAETDVLIENFKLGGLKKFGLDYEAISKLNPRIVYASVTGFGQTGPRAANAGYDFLIQGMSGIMDLTGEPSGEPQKVGVAWIDIFTGLYGVIGIQAALPECAHSRLGQHIDLSLFDVGGAVLANQAMNYLVGGAVPHRMGNAHPNIVPYQVFPSCDGHLIIACGNDRQFAALCQVLELNGAATDPDYATNAARVENRLKLCARIGDRIAAKAGAHCRTRSCRCARRPYQYDSRGTGRSSDQSARSPDRVRGYSSPPNADLFSRTPLSLSKPGPTLGNGAWQFMQSKGGEQK